MQKFCYSITIAVYEVASASDPSAEHDSLIELAVCSTTSRQLQIESVG